MLKKGRRLRTQVEFARVFRQGTPLFFGAIGCKIVKNDLGYLRLGFSISKKHLERAISRNRVRRALAAVFVDAGKKIEKKPLDVVFFTTKRLSETERATVASHAQSIVEWISSKY